MYSFASLAAYLLIMKIIKAEKDGANRRGKRKMENARYEVKQTMSKNVLSHHSFILPICNTQQLMEYTGTEMQTRPQELKIYASEVSTSIPQKYNKIGAIGREAIIVRSKYV
ncbi:hypothetical protein X798_03190, partial [Onchocerca flexuosa]